MRDCNCGKPVRLGAIRVRLNNRNGVCNYIAHRDGSACEHLKAGKWDCVELKPYARHERDREWHKMLARWEEGTAVMAQAGSAGGSK